MKTTIKVSCILLMLYALYRVIINNEFNIVVIILFIVIVLKIIEPHIKDKE